MFVVQNNEAYNLNNCDKVEVAANEILAEIEGYSAPVAIAEFETHEQAQKYFSLILKAYYRGDKVFYC